MEPLKLEFKGDEVGGSSRGGTDVFVTLTAHFNGTNDELRQLLGDEERLEQQVNKAFDTLLPWAECDGRKDWDGETGPYVSEEWFKNFYERELSSDQVFVVPVRHSEDETEDYLVAGQSEHYEFHVEDTLDNARHEVLETLRLKSLWCSRLDSPCEWKLTSELYREGNAE